MILSKILDAIMDQRDESEFLEFNAGKKKNDYGSTRIRVAGETREHLNDILGEVLRLRACVFICSLAHL
jgi:hypothetical protein